MSTQTHTTRSKTMNLPFQPWLERAEEGFERAGEIFLHSMGLPHANDFETLRDRVETLTDSVRELQEQWQTETTVYHLVPHDEGWQLKIEGDERALSNHGTKKKALDAGRDLANEQAPSRLVVHRQDGTIQTSYDYEI